VHREGEIGEACEARHYLAAGAQRARIERTMQRAIGPAGRRRQEALVPHFGDQVSYDRHNGRSQLVFVMHD
jgi:hypothetical protein